MINSNNRKLCLSGWLKCNREQEYNTPLKLQKFLLLYEAFSKVAGETPDFSHLKGYKRGPVFSHVWGDYTKERSAFDLAAEKCYKDGKADIDEIRAKKSAFIVAILSEKELSDFNIQDVELISMLERMYPVEMIDSSAVIDLDNHYFVFDKTDIPKLTEEHFDTLSILTENEELHNPIYVDIDEEGSLIVD